MSRKTKIVRAFLVHLLPATGRPLESILKTLLGSSTANLISIAKTHVQSRGLGKSAHHCRMHAAASIPHLQTLFWPSGFPGLTPKTAGQPVSLLNRIGL